MLPVFLDLDPADTDADGICESQTPAASGVQSLTMNGALADLGTAGEFDITDFSSTGIAGIRIGITSAGSDSGRTFTVTGRDDLGRDATEAITGADVGTAESTTYWSYISGITTDDDTAGAITVGTVDEFLSKTIPLNWRATNFKVGFQIDITGTIDFTVQHTMSDIQDSSVTPAWFDHDDVADINSIDTVDNYIIPVRAIRLQVNSFTDTAEIAFNVVQGG